LARSEDRDSSFSLLQIERFKDVLSIYDRRGISRPLAHCGNSGAILYGQDDLFDMVRPGLLLYGLLPDHSREEKINVKPCLTWKTKVVYFKVVQAGVPVSYGGTWTSPKMTRIVTLPVGYGDGYFRALSNRAKVIIRGKTYPVIGNICMDQMMVDIGWDEAFNGDEVILLGVDGENTITADNLAEWAGTISYEILTNINARVPRLYLEPKKKAKKNRIPKQVSGKHTFKGVYKGMNE
jgi:alanine racemase